MSKLSFISDEDFKMHVCSTITNYGDKLAPYDLDKFNCNIIDPIKLIFDKTIFGYDWEEIINNEVFRQRDKSNNNDIGYFHQNIFRYIDCCKVPTSGWDVVFEKKEGIQLPEEDRVAKVFVEMKNKHNTMNSSASSRTYMNMQAKLLEDDNCACFLVETIARESQNITWVVSIDGSRHRHRRIRRVSMDEFYKMVTGIDDAFYKMCLLLPDVIQEVVEESEIKPTEHDSVFEELQEIANRRGGSIAIALYILGFKSYRGFDSI